MSTSGSGFLVRTRADAGFHQAKSKDTKQRDKALASGAQLISTDFPQADPRYPDYEVSFGKESAARANAVRSADRE